MSRPLIFKNRDFAKMWFGQVLSQSGTRMYQMAIVWWIVTSSREQVGKVAGIFLVCSALPSVLFVNRIGHWVDSFRTKSIMLMADGLNTVLVATTAGLLFAWPELPIEVLYVAGFFISLLQGITDPGFAKAVPQVVEAEDLEAATAFQTSALSLGFFLGAGLGAFLMPALGVAGVIAANAVTYLISFLCIAGTRFRFAQPPASVAAGKPSSESAWAIINRYPLYKKLLLGMALVNFVTVPTFVILPLYVARVLKANAFTLGWIESGIWLGIIFGTLLTRRVRLSENVEHLGAICCALLAVGLAAPGVFVNAYFFFAMAFLQGAAFAFIPVRFIGLFQQGLPLESKGRFFALMSALLSATPPLSQFVAGILADQVPITTLCLMQGAGAVLMAVFCLAPSGFGATRAMPEECAV